MSSYLSVLCCKLLSSKISCYWVQHADGRYGYKKATNVRVNNFRGLQSIELNLDSVKNKTDKKGVNYVAVSRQLSC